MHGKLRLTSIATALIAAFSMSAAHATNGMHMEGYGPIATSMGGAALAFDVGNGAMAHNPATLGYLSSGSRLELAIGNLRPDINSTHTAMPAGTPGRSVDSDADSFLMPAAGWARRAGDMVYGVGVYAIGGMGTEYSGNSFMSAGTGEKSLSQVGVGRVIAPLSFDVSPDLTVGGSLDLMWGGFDLQMAMPVMADTDGDGTPDAGPGTFADFSAGFGGSEVLGSASFSPSIDVALQTMIGGGVNAVRFNFADSSDFTGSAKGLGFGGKLGFTYKVNPDLSIGGVFHTKIAMGDYETGGSGATLEGYATSPTGATKVGEISGKMKVKDFDWPAIIGIGFAYNATPELLLAADVKQIRWSDVMEVFKMQFVADGNNAGIAQGETIDIKMNQDWDDQTVLSLGAAYDVSPELTIRAGANIASNPVPDEFMNPLFPAIIENHYTAGFTYRFSPANAFSASLSLAPKVTQKNTSTFVETEHSQTNLQLMYTHQF